MGPYTNVKLMVNTYGLKMVMMKMKENIQVKSNDHGTICNYLPNEFDTWELFSCTIFDKPCGYRKLQGNVRGQSIQVRGVEPPTTLYRTKWANRLR